MDILRDNSGLVRLGHICEHHVHHPYQEAVVLRFPGVVDYRNDVCSLFGHVHQISTHSVREFDSVDHACWADYVRNVGNGCARGCSEVEHFASRPDSDFRHAACHRSCDFGAVRIPNAILDLFAVDLNADALFVVD